MFPLAGTSAGAGSSHGGVSDMLVSSTLPQRPSTCPPATPGNGILQNVRCRRMAQGLTLQYASMSCFGRKAKYDANLTSRALSMSASRKCVRRRQVRGFLDPEALRL